MICIQDLKVFGICLAVFVFCSKGIQAETGEMDSQVTEMVIQGDAILVQSIESPNIEFDKIRDRFSLGDEEIAGNLIAPPSAFGVSEVQYPIEDLRSHADGFDFLKNNPVLNLPDTSFIEHQKVEVVDRALSTVIMDRADDGGLLEVGSLYISQSETGYYGTVRKYGSQYLIRPLTTASTRKISVTKVPFSHRKRKFKGDTGPSQFFVPELISEDGYNKYKNVKAPGKVAATAINKANLDCKKIEEELDRLASKPKINVLIAYTSEAFEEYKKTQEIHEKFEAFRVLESPAFYHRIPFRNLVEDAIVTLKRSIDVSGVRIDLEFEKPDQWLKVDYSSLNHPIVGTVKVEGVTFESDNSVFLADALTIVDRESDLKKDLMAKVLMKMKGDKAKAAYEKIKRNKPELVRLFKERERRKADVVLLVSHNDIQTECGFVPVTGGGAENAFAIVNWKCLLTQNSFTHEFGHLLGAHHDDIRKGATQYDIARGFVVEDKVSELMGPFGTVMVTDNTLDSKKIHERDIRFSNPRIEIAPDTPIGQDGFRDNACIMNLNAERVSKFY